MDRIKQDTIKALEETTAKIYFLKKQLTENEKKAERLAASIETIELIENQQETKEGGE